MALPRTASGARAAGRAPRFGRIALIALVLLAVLGLALVASLVFGARQTSLDDVWRALTDYDAASAAQGAVVLRIPRTIAGLIVGAALAVAGAAMQGVTRNPLADPGLLGISAGASLTVVGGLALFGLGGIGALMGLGFLGAAAGAVIVYGLALTSRGGATPLTLALTGAVFTAGALSVQSALLAVNASAYDAFRLWSVGVLGARSIDDMLIVLVPIGLGLGLVLASIRGLNALALGDELAGSLGIRVARTRIVLGLACVLLVGGAVAIAGPIGFVGLVVPHALRTISGNDYRALILHSALAGPVLLLAADIVGRVVLPPGEVQVGVMTAIIGAPVFIWLLQRGRRVAL